MIVSRHRVRDLRRKRGNTLARDDDDAPLFGACVERCAALVRDTPGARLVLSSSWRHALPLKVRLFDALVAAGMPADALVGETPRISFRERASEVGRRSRSQKAAPSRARRERWREREGEKGAEGLTHGRWLLGRAPRVYGARWACAPDRRVVARAAAARATRPVGRARRHGLVARSRGES